MYCGYITRLKNLRPHSNADRRDYEQESKELDELTKKAFAEMAEVFWSLWD